MFWILVFLALLYFSPRIFFIRQNRISANLVSQSVIFDLMISGLRTGMSIPATLVALQVALGKDPQIKLVHTWWHFRKQNLVVERSLQEVSNLLLMGATWETAWQGVNSRYSVLAEVLEPAWKEGASPIPMLERSAFTLRMQKARREKEAAAKLGAKLVIPLTTCFLPAFIGVGVLPIILASAPKFF